MDVMRFDTLTRSFATTAPRRATLRTLAAALAALLVGGGGEEAGAACKKPGKRCRKGDRCCGGAACKGKTCKCPRGRKPCRRGCIPVANCCSNADCGGGATCQNGTCADCPAGQKPCQGACILNAQCCDNGDCLGGETCCTNVRQCKDVRNDPAFCGQCGNGQCPGGAICANGDCGLTCTTVGAACFSGCECANRVDPDHLDQKVCARPVGATCTGGVCQCDFVKNCTDDASCAPGTAGFREVCVSGLCPGENVCADPCA